MTVSAAQPINEMKMSFEIDSETISMFSDLANVLSDRPDNNPITAATKPDKPGKPAPTPDTESYALTIEIDYIEGHMPTQTVLDYITLYYAGKNIELTFVIDDPIPDAASYDNGISYQEFLTIEATYNDGNDKANYNPTFELTKLKEKWVLYGTSVENEENTVGYTLCWGTTRDLIAGNWMYIADGKCDSITTDSNLQMGIEAVVLMHEFGHSIGICTVRLGSEVYCSDYYCVMSYLRPENAGNMNKWYYCDRHWKTRNLDYYVV